MKREQPRQTALSFVLKGLVPYTRENLLLSYRPHKFFNELERVSGYSRPTLQTSFYRARRKGLVTASKSGTPILTMAGKQRLQPFVATKLKGGGQLMVIFDVPEEVSATRRQFRLALKHLGFRQVQQSVWMTEYDHREFIKELVSELQLEECVQMYEAARLFPR